MAILPTAAVDATTAYLYGPTVPGSIYTSIENIVWTKPSGLDYNTDITWPLVIPVDGTGGATTNTDRVAIEWDTCWGTVTVPPASYTTTVGNVTQYRNGGGTVIGERAHWGTITPSVGNGFFEGRIAVTTTNHHPAPVITSFTVKMGVPGGDVIECDGSGSSDPGYSGYVTHASFGISETHTEPGAALSEWLWTLRHSSAPSTILATASGQTATLDATAMEPSYPTYQLWLMVRDSWNLQSSGADAESINYPHRRTSSIMHPGGFVVSATAKPPANNYSLFDVVVERSDIGTVKTFTSQSEAPTLSMLDTATMKLAFGNTGFVTSTDGGAVWA